MALRSWVWSWFSNLIGSLTIVYFAHWAGIRKRGALCFILSDLPLL